MTMMNPKDLQKAMKRFGVQQTDVRAIRVVVECEDYNLVFESPQVAKVSMMGQESWQVVGTPVEVAKDDTPKVSDEDVQTVVEQTRVSADDAKAALLKNKGDIAKTIMELSDGK